MWRIEAAVAGDPAIKGSAVANTASSTESAGVRSRRRSRGICSTFDRLRRALYVLPTMSLAPSPVWRMPNQA